jgi:hypothetical protein
MLDIKRVAKKIVPVTTVTARSSITVLTIFLLRFLTAIENMLSLVFIKEL